MKIHFLLLLCSSLLVAGQKSDLKVEVEELETVEDPEVSKGYFEGDIELPKDPNADKDSDIKWPSGVLFYKISDNVPKTTRATILEAMREIESNTKNGSNYCVRFVEKTSPKECNYVSIQKGTDGCHSSVGRQGGEQVLSLGKGCERKGIIMHELIHALGFWHEQSRSDRDTYVNIFTNNIDPQLRRNFNKGRYNSKMETGYDLGSIMHYGPYKFAKDKSKPTISPKGKASGVTMGQRLAMSTQDVARIQKLYECTVDVSHITRLPKSDKIVDCNFEQGIYGLIQDTKDDFDWTRISGSTPAPYIGPKADHTNSRGFYLYAKASHHHNNKARLQTKTLSKGDYCLDFWLFQYGSDAGTFQARVTGPLIRDRAVITVAGSQGQYWKNYRTNVKVPANFNLILEGTIGNGDKSDIAIDDLLFYKGRCM